MAPSPSYSAVPLLSCRCRCRIYDHKLLQLTFYTEYIPLGDTPFYTVAGNPKGFEEYVLCCGHRKLAVVLMTYLVVALAISPHQQQFLALPRIMFRHTLVRFHSFKILVKLTTSKISCTQSNIMQSYDLLLILI